MIQGAVDNWSSIHFPHNIETMHPTIIRDVNLVAALFFIYLLPLCTLLQMQCQKRIALSFLS